LVTSKVINTLTSENHHVSNGQEIVELLQKVCMFGLQEHGENLMHHFVFGLLFLHVHNKVLDEHFAMHVVIIFLLKIYILVVKRKIKIEY
jgi:hypothetical protein